MQPTSTNGNSVSAREMLDGLRRLVDGLEAEVQKQREEITQLRAERDEFRAVVYDYAKKQFGGPEAWADFNEKDYTLNLDDLLAVIREK